MADGPHTIVKAEKWAAAALGLLEREIVLAGLVSRDSGADFVGAKNDTVNIKRPSLLAGTVEALRDSRDAADYAIVSEELNERSISVKLDTHAYSAVDLTDAELSLDLASFGAQVLSPQVKAVANRVEFQLAQKFNELTPIAFTGTSEDTGFVGRAIVSLRKELNKNEVPMSGRVLLVGVDVEEFILNDPNLVKVHESGSDSALRSAEIGRLRGFRVVVSNSIAADRMVAFHPSAYTLTTRAPRVPEGAASGRSESYAGIALRAIRDYNSRIAQDRSFVNTFVGIGETTDRPITYDADGTPTIGETPEMLRAVAGTVAVSDPSS